MVRSGLTRSHISTFGGSLLRQPSSQRSAPSPASPHAASPRPNRTRPQAQRRVGRRVATARGARPRGVSRHGSKRPDSTFSTVRFRNATHPDKVALAGVYEPGGPPAEHDARHAQERNSGSDFAVFIGRTAPHASRRSPPGRSTQGAGSPAPCSTHRTGDPESEMSRRAWSRENTERGRT